MPRVNCDPKAGSGRTFSRAFCEEGSGVEVKLQACVHCQHLSHRACACVHLGGRCLNKCACLSCLCSVSAGTPGSQGSTGNTGKGWWLWYLRDFCTTDCACKPTFICKCDVQQCLAAACSVDQTPYSSCRLLAYAGVGATGPTGATGSTGQGAAGVAVPAACWYP